MPPTHPPHPPHTHSLRSALAPAPTTHPDLQLGVPRLLRLDRLALLHQLHLQPSAAVGRCGQLRLLPPQRLVLRAQVLHLRAGARAAAAAKHATACLGSLPQRGPTVRGAPVGAV
jgi:hypothetical protein